MCASTSKEASDNVGQGATRERVGVGVALAALAKRIRFTHILNAAGVNLARDEELQVELVSVGTTTTTNRHHHAAQHTRP